MVSVRSNKYRFRTLEHIQNMDHFTKIVNGFKSLFPQISSSQMFDRFLDTPMSKRGAHAKKSNSYWRKYKLKVNKDHL